MFLFRKKSDSLEFLNVKTQNPFERNLIKKGLNQLMMPWNFRRDCSAYLDGKDFDLIIYATPPVTLAPLIEYLKKRFKSKTFLMLKDIFPQNAVDLQFFGKRSPLYYFYRKQEERYYAVSDFIGCMSEANRKYLIEHNKELLAEKIVIFPNSISVEDLPKVDYKTDGRTSFIFGGNLGKPQGISFLMEVIRSLNDYERAYFYIIGDGAESYLVEEYIHKFNLNNVFYHETLPRDEYEKIIEKSNVGLISLDSRFTIPNVPSRMQGYLKLGKPILALTDTNTDVKDMIEINDCGWWESSADVSKAVDLIKYICENPDECIRKSQNCQPYLCKEFDVRKNSELLECLFD